METEVAVEGNDEGKLEESGFGKSSSSLSSPKTIADPIVYKLVRVEGDGRLVPATDDEVMEVEGLLLDDKTAIDIVADTGQNVGCPSNEGSYCGMHQLESSEGLSQSENMGVDPDKLNARLEYIEEMLQKVKEEERLRLACGSPDYSSAYVIVASQCTDQHDKLPGIDEKLQCEIPLQETVPTLAPCLSESHMNRSGSIGECSNPSNKAIEGASSISATITTSKPDFLKLKGELCLDNLSIKELHETFKATFGRDTTVKDKQWLKRRITMGLTNSCDVPTTSFVIKDNKLVKKGNDESCDNEDGSFAKDPAIGATNGNQEDLPISHGSELENHQVSEKRLRNQSIDDNFGSEDHQTEQRTAKRVRKPTRRYIEELSEVEPKDSSGRIMNSAKNSGLGPLSPKSLIKPIRNVFSDGRTVITRLDSLGGSGIQVPCVSRVRRSRPRKNFMALLKFDPSGIGMAATLVTKALGGHSFQPDDWSGNKLIQAKSTPEHIQHQLAGVPEKDGQFSAMGTVGVAHNMELKCAGSPGDSDDNIVTVPTSKGGIRRKHHRAWTLSEVMKLVEGVSRYGAGRWSEIKRLAFASYSYRTSVDLKDKWRNLLKASFAQSPPDKGMNPRKNTGSMLIPEPILLKVRELAEMHTQGSPNLSSSKVAGSARKSVHEKQSGFL